MKEFQKKRKIRGALFSPFTLTLLALLFVFLLVSAAGVYRKSKMASSKSDEVKVKIERLKERKSELEKELNRLRSGFGREEELRKKFNLRKPDEKVLIIADKDGKPKEKTPEANPPGFFPRVWQALENIF
ncbi:MAG: hypothetical protein GXP44_03355 [bacterium]|nr:hypothetical protein [bacterium]